jgi:hypothetical protein
MQHVPLKQRLTSCCLVNRRLHEAAVAATSELRLSFGSSDDSISEEAMDCASEWLSLYGQHVTSLHVDGSCQVLVHPLPCPNLQSLHMFDCNVQLGRGADGTAGVIHGCTKLTYLELTWTMFDTSTPEGAVVDSLSSLVHLQHLSVSPHAESAPLNGLSTATLPSLPHLTHLGLTTCPLRTFCSLAPSPACRSCAWPLRLTCPSAPQLALALYCLHHSQALRSCQMFMAASCLWFLQGCRTF